MKRIALLIAILAIGLIVNEDPASAWSWKLSNTTVCSTGTTKATFTLDNTGESQAATVRSTNHADVVPVGTVIPARGKLTRTVAAPYTLTLGVNWPSDSLVRVLTSTANKLPSCTTTTTTVKPTTTTAKPTTTTTVKVTTTTQKATTTTTWPATSTTTTVVVPTTVLAPTTTTSSTSTTVKATTTTVPVATSTTLPASTTSTVVITPNRPADPLADTGADIRPFVQVGLMLLFVGILLLGVGIIVGKYLKRRFC